MIKDPTYRELIETAVTNGGHFYDSPDIQLLKQCLGCKLTGVSEKKCLENTLAMMEIRDNKLPIHEHLNSVFKNFKSY